jgi:AcrR family transcriptional regulator
LATTHPKRPLLSTDGDSAAGARGEIIDAALKLFATRGYRATSVQDLADELGYGKASLYHYVKSKNDILVAIHELFMRRLIDDANAVVAGDGSAADKLRLIIVNFVDLVGRHRAEATVVNEEMKELSPRTLKRVVAERDEYERMITRLVEEAQAAGDIDVADPHVAVRAILGMVNWCYRWLKVDGALSPREVGAQMAALVLHRAPHDAVPGTRSPR